MIKAIIFDYFGVICSDEYWNSVKEDKNLKNTFHNLSTAVNIGDLHWREFLERVAQKTGGTVRDIQGLYEKQKIDPRLLAYVVKIHKNYKTGILSNANHEFLDSVVDEANLKEVFDSIVISSRVGKVKPQPEIYHYILKSLDVKPHEAVFIDDIESYCTAAKDLGLKTVIYRNFGQFKQELETLLEDYQ